VMRESPVMTEPSSTDKQITYVAVSYQGVTYETGDCAYLSPTSFLFNYKMHIQFEHILEKT